MSVAFRAYDRCMNREDGSWSWDTGSFPVVQTTATAATGAAVEVSVNVPAMDGPTLYRALQEILNVLGPVACTCDHLMTCGLPDEVAEALRIGRTALGQRPDPPANSDPL